MDYPLKEIQSKANTVLAQFPGSQVHFKFTCAKCGSRQTFDVPNTLYASGTCEECGNETVLDRAGFDFYMDMRGGRK